MSGKLIHHEIAGDTAQINNIGRAIKGITCSEYTK
jgi:hypothetical protein